MRGTVFLTYICVGIILLTSKKFTDVCVAGNGTDLLLQYVAKNLLVLLVHV